MQLMLHLSAGAHELRFLGVSGVTLSHVDGWGSSSSINSQWVDRGTFVVEVQSGDLVRVEAEAFELVRSA